jgi:hypothetical protein
MTQAVSPEFKPQYHKKKKKSYNLLISYSVPKALYKTLAFFLLLHQRDSYFCEST